MASKKKFVAVQRFNFLDIAVGYYLSPDWQVCIEAFDAWDGNVYDWLDDGLSADQSHLEQLTETLVDALHKTAGIDPMPVWEVYLVVSGRRKATYDDVSHLYQRAQMLYGMVLRAGLAEEPPVEGAEKRPGRKPSDAIAQRREDVLYQHKVEGRRSRGLVARILSTPSRPVSVANVRDDLKYLRELPDSQLADCPCKQCVKFFTGRTVKSVE